MYTMQSQSGPVSVSPFACQVVMSGSILVIRYSKQYHGLGEINLLISFLFIAMMVSVRI